MLENFVSPYDATVVERLAAAGAVVLGKTNMDEFAMGSSNETSFFGPVKNPWDLELLAGRLIGRFGRSGCGTSCTGGDRHGHRRFDPPASSPDRHGRPETDLWARFALRHDRVRIQSRPGRRHYPFGEDAALLLGVMAGFDERDSTSIDHPVPDYSAGAAAFVKGTARRRIVRQHFDEGLDENTGKAVKEALAVLEASGAILTDVDLPNIDLSVPTYYVVAPAECSSNLSRFDGVRFGHRAENPEDLLDLYCRSRGEGFGDEVKRRIMTGTYVLSAGYYDAYYLKAQQVRQLIADDFHKAFENVDVIAGPTAPTPAFKLGDKTDDPITMYLNDIYTIGANLAGLPACRRPAVS